MIFISHHLEEVTEIGDRVTVLRDGKMVGQVPATTDHRELVRMMVGAPSSTSSRAGGRGRGVLLEVEGTRARGRLHDISFEVRAGEVVGIAGMVGAGRTEVARAIFGADPLRR